LKEGETMSINAKVHKSKNPDRMTVESGGSIHVKTGGTILPNSGTQAATIANTVAAAGATPTKAEFDAVVTALNASLAALKGVGIIASS
jgi:hypothetical protein